MELAGGSTRIEQRICNGLVEDGLVDMIQAEFDVVMLKRFGLRKWIIVACPHSPHMSFETTGAKISLGLWRRS